MMTDAKGGLGVEGKQDETVMGRLDAQGNGSGEVEVAEYWAFNILISGTLACI